MWNETDCQNYMAVSWINRSQSKEAALSLTFGALEGSKQNARPMNYRFLLEYKAGDTRCKKVIKEVTRRTNCWSGAGEAHWTNEVSFNVQYLQKYLFWWVIQRHNIINRKGTCRSATNTFSLDIENYQINSRGEH